MKKKETTTLIANAYHLPRYLWGGQSSLISQMLQNWYNDIYWLAHTPRAVNYDTDAVSV